MQRSVFAAAKQPRHSIKSSTQTDISHSPNGHYGMSGAEGTYSGLMPVNLTTLLHFSVSAAI
jgi:hypothetical protein